MGRAPTACARRASPSPGPSSRCRPSRPHRRCKGDFPGGGAPPPGLSFPRLSMGMTRLLYASDFDGAEAFFRKFLGAALQYQAKALIVGGDVTGKAMIPILHKGGGRYEAYLFGRKESPAST